MEVKRHLSTRLKLLELDYMITPVRVQALKDIGIIPLPGGEMDVRRGDEFEVPRWQAMLLEDLGLVEIKEKDMDLDEVNLYHYREKRTQAGSVLQSIPQDFYYRVRELIRKLNAEIRRNPATMLLRDRETVEKNVLEIADTRLAKIIRLAQAGSEEQREKMMPEETLVYNAIRAILDAWREYISKIVSPEVEENVKARGGA